MKKLLLFFIVITMAINVLADQPYDIITTTDGKKIEAIISEVSKTEIKYHEVGFPESTTFVISTDEISTIAFSNGQVKTYIHNTYQPTTQPETRPIETAISEQKTSKKTGNIKVVDGHYFLDNTPITSEELKNELMKCPASYNLYTKGYGMQIGGAVVLGVGLGLSLGDAIGMIIKSAYGLKINTEIGLSIGGSVLALAVGLPLELVGERKVKESINLYNNKCSLYSDLQLQFQLNQNGIGLALKF